MTIVKIRFQKSGGLFLLIVLLAAMLLTLAWLQYRWIGQTSDSERERMQKSAKLAAANLSRDFDSELTRVFLELQLDAASLESKNWDNYAARRKRWMATALYPKMVGDIFIAHRDEQDVLRLSVFNEKTSRFEETTWLPQLDHARREIERDLDSAEKTKLTQIGAADFPTLLIPITSVNFMDLKKLQVDAEQNAAQFRGSIQHIGYTIVPLDFGYIKKELFPILVERYFNLGGSEDVSSYDIKILTRDDPAQIVYQSNESLAGAEISVESDAESELFALNFNDIQNLLSTRQGQSLLTNGKRTESNFSVSVVVAAPPNSTESASSSGAGSPTVQTGRWRLFARHRGGSLEETVNAMRRRNLTVSFGILLLLAGSGTLLIVLLNRSQRFARRQSDFVASVTHELRTPLAVIRAASENIADGILADAAQIKEYGSLIKDEEQRLSVMVEQVLEFAGARAANNHSYQFRCENIAEILETALGDYKTELRERNFQIVLEIEPNLPQISADREALRRAVGNLIGNGIKYARENQMTRRLEISVCSVSGKTTKQIEIIIKDNGTGIEKYDLPHIFKLFYRGRTAAARQIKGSGIGLSLVKQTVEAHSGAVNVKSEPGRGSAFTLRLPAATADAVFDTFSTNQN